MSHRVGAYTSGAAVFCKGSSQWSPHIHTSISEPHLESRGDTAQGGRLTHACRPADTPVPLPPFNPDSLHRGCALSHKLDSRRGFQQHMPGCSYLFDCHQQCCQDSMEPSELGVPALSDVVVSSSAAVFKVSEGQTNPSQGMSLSEIAGLPRMGRISRRERSKSLKSPPLQSEFAFPKDACT